MASAPVESSPSRFSRPRGLRARVLAWLQPQVSGGRREQRDQTLLLLAVATVMLPHFGTLPLWAVGTITIFWLWRAWLTQSLRPEPARLVTGLMLLAVTAAVWAENGTIFGRVASVQLLLVLTSLKVLELRARRDVMVIVFLCLFALLTRFLDDESLAAALQMGVSVFLLFLVLLSVNLAADDLPLAAKARFVGGVMLRALPLALVLFYFFPRLPSPVWAVPGGARAKPRDSRPRCRRVRSAACSRATRSRCGCTSRAPRQPTRSFTGAGRCSGTLTAAPGRPSCPPRTRSSPTGGSCASRPGAASTTR